MTSFVSGADRTQGTMFPERLEDYVASDNPVRVIDFFVDQLDLGQLGFWRVRPKLTGRPAYAPAVLLKIYVYGYLNRVPSSRRLERECQRNVEVMWLTGCLAPDFKTIADFRKDNGPAIRKVCREFIVVCGRAGLLTATTVAIDGSKFKAVNSRDRNFTQTKVAKRLEQIEASIERYLSELETADRQPSTPEIKRTRLKGKIDRLKQEIERMEAIEAQLASAKDTQISLTDPDARSMQGTGKATGTIGYNVQCAVEMDHHLIVVHDVTNAVHDRHQLFSIAQQAKEALGAEAIEAIADRGYYDGKEILACEQAGVTAYVPRISTSGAKAEGRFGKQDFVYKANEDVYLCPAGERLTYRYTNEEDGKVLRSYWGSVCLACPLKEKCTTGKERRIKRWEHEAVLEAAQARLDRRPNAMTERRSTAEHPFGTIKFWMGSAHFLMKRLGNVRTEMSLHVLSYNMKRVMTILGVPGLLQAMRA
ncbi:IS1182 family transposase [Rhodomicrobium lacus]|uniref:IS1182 family transposase n=1 Tax=Rhodomicrobium lacus TaxID=2498452 RepID=UPI0026E30F7B|nr:IS1182 family transposase [Rhodomicrobium lacus]WKW51494.1 IS1182 family transposase [Rhodomicrobium lacus]